MRQIAVPPEIAWELLVIDNNSSDNTKEVVEEFRRTSGLDVRYFFEPMQGQSHARNTGVRNAAGDIVAFTDDDVLVAAEWLKELAGIFANFDCIGAGGRSVPIWNGLVRPDWLVTVGPYKLSRGPSYEFDFGDEARRLQEAPWGLNMAFARSAFEKYGLFRTDLGASGTQRILGEDTEFGRRLIGAGEKVMYCPGAVVFHPVDPKRVTRSYFLSFYMNMGRAATREEGWPAGAVLYFGVPRYMFRSLLVNCAKWLIALGKEKRFHRKVQVYFCLGQIAEAHALQNKGIRQRSTNAEGQQSQGNRNPKELRPMEASARTILESSNGPDGFSETKFSRK